MFALIGMLSGCGAPTVAADVTTEVTDGALVLDGRDLVSDVAFFDANDASGADDGRTSSDAESGEGTNVGADASLPASFDGIQCGASVCDGPPASVCCRTTELEALMCQMEYATDINSQVESNCALCDGPEDCPSGQVCCEAPAGWTNYGGVQCADPANCVRTRLTNSTGYSDFQLTLCHSDTDCPAAFPYCSGDPIEPYTLGSGVYTCCAQPCGADCCLNTHDTCVDGRCCAFPCGSTCCLATQSCCNGTCIDAGFTESNGLGCYCCNSSCHDGNPC